jgi:RNA recognition motif-containing protein
VRSSRSRDRERDRYREGSTYGDVRRERNVSRSRDRDRPVDTRDLKSNDSRVAETRSSSGSATETKNADRTIFVSGIYPKVSEDELFEFFSIAGQVNDVRLIRDPYTDKSKGLCYVEFDSVDDIEAAMGLNGQLLAGYPITLRKANEPAPGNQQANPARQRQRRDTNESSTRPNDGIQPQRSILPTSNKDKSSTSTQHALFIDPEQVGDEYPLQLFVGSLDFTVTEDDLRTLFV